MGMAQVKDIESIGDEYAEKLQAVGVTTVESLLEKGATPGGRAALAQQTGISAKLILRWVNHADLFRIKGVAGQYAELLEASGVDTVAELSQRNPANLHSALVSANEEKKLAGVTPSLSQVSAWVAEATALPRVVVY